MTKNNSQIYPNYILLFFILVLFTLYSIIAPGLSHYVNLKDKNIDTQIQRLINKFLVVLGIFAIVFIILSIRLKAKQYLYFSAFLINLILFNLSLCVRDIFSDNQVFNYLFSYKPFYISIIFFVIFFFEYEKINKNYSFIFMLIIPFLAFMVDFALFDKNSSFKLFQIFNIVFYLWIFILIFISFFNYLKSKNGTYEILSILFLLIFLAYTNDFVVFKEPEKLKEIYSPIRNHIYLSNFSFIFSGLILAFRLLIQLIDSSYKYQELSGKMLELAKEYKVKEEAIVESVQRSIDQARQSIIYSESLRMEGNEFSKIVYDFINILVKLKEQLLASSKNEDEFAVQSTDLKKKLTEIAGWYENALEILEKTIEKLNSIIISSSQIDTIVDQTALLSLNSSVVAAKAKDKGKGFSIVSEEIRKLASRSGSFSENAQQKLNQILEVAKTGRIRSDDFKAVYRDFFEKFNSIFDDIIENRDNYKSFLIKINELVGSIDGISLLTKQIDDKSAQLYKIALSIEDTINETSDKNK